MIASFCENEATVVCRRVIPVVGAPFGSVVSIQVIPPALVAKHGGKYLVRGSGIERLEGSGTLPSVFAMSAALHAIIWFAVQSVSWSPSHAATVACGLSRPAPLLQPSQGDPAAFAAARPHRRRASTLPP